MRVHCRTMLELPDEEWPVDLPAVPSVGDYICSKTVWQHGFRLCLRVCAIIWVNQSDVWQPEIELHDGRRRTRRQFYKWYAPLIGRSPEDYS